MAREKWIVCPVCEGSGKTVNPDIDAHGLTREDFDDDPDFAESYRSGLYDIACRGCGGKRVVAPERVLELEESADDRRLAALENGDFEAYASAHDWRYG
jgi:hypothetical protein